MRIVYFIPTPPNRANGEGRPGYRIVDDIKQAEPDSDLWAVKVDRVVSVTPLSLDLTSRVNFATLLPGLQADPTARLAGFSRAITLQKGHSDGTLWLLPHPRHWAII